MTTLSPTKEFSVYSQSMQSNLLNIRVNIELRTDYQVNAVQAQDFANNFSNKVLSPAREAFNNLRSVEGFEEDDFNKSEHTLMAATSELATQRLCGFDKIQASSEGHEFYSIGAEFKISSGQTLTLQSDIRRCIFGDGSEIKNWNLKLDGFDVTGILTETDCEDDICDFILGNFDSNGHFDLAMKPISEEEIAQIALILGA